MEVLFNSLLLLVKIEGENAETAFVIEVVAYPATSSSKPDAAATILLQSFIITVTINNLFQCNDSFVTVTRFSYRCEPKNDLFV